MYIKIYKFYPTSVRVAFLKLLYRFFFYRPKAYHSCMKVGIKDANTSHKWHNRKVHTLYTSGDCELESQWCHSGQWEAREQWPAQACCGWLWAQDAEEGEMILFHLSVRVLLSVLQIEFAWFNVFWRKYMMVFTLINCCVTWQLRRNRIDLVSSSVTSNTFNFVHVVAAINLHIT